MDSTKTYDGVAREYEPPAVTDLGPLVQLTAGTGTRARVDAGGASV